MRLFNKVAIIGVGLIGGSMALAIRKRHLAKEIIGVSRRRETLLLARQRGMIDKASQDFNIIKDADLVILAVPISTIIKTAQIISKIISPDCIVTDVGSTKQDIVLKLEKIFPNFVGSHPLAGSEKRGVSNASAEIFNNSLCILTPTKNTNGQALRKINRLWKDIGTKVIPFTPQVHDKILSTISHLPHVVAFSLITSIPKGYLKFAANSLKDTTRIAASDSGLWVDIFLSNKKNLLKGIELFEKNISLLKSVIKSSDRKSLSRILKQAKNKRDGLEKAIKQALPNPKNDHSYRRSCRFG